MNKEQIDILWQQAITAANINGDPDVRYEFAKIILEKTADACKTEWNADSDSYEEALARHEYARRSHQQLSDAQQAIKDAYKAGYSAGYDACLEEQEE